MLQQPMIEKLLAMCRHGLAEAKFRRFGAGSEGLSRWLLGLLHPCDRPVPRADAGAR